MKFFLPFVAVLFSFHWEFVLLDYVGEEPTEDTTLPEPFLPVAKTFELTTPSQNDFLDNISIQDVLSSDIDASEKIEKKILSVVKQYALHCRTYKRIDLSIEGLIFPKSSITINLDSANVTFYNIRISESSQSSSKRKSYSTSIGCDSAKMTKIEVKLPKDLEIYADLTVTEITDSSSGLSSAYEILNSGSISLTLKHNLISKKFSNQLDDADSITSKMFYSKSVVSLDIATKFQMPIYNKLQIFFDEVEPPLRQFLVEKLDVEFDCSKFINSDKNSKKVNLPFFNSNLNHLYVIPNTKLEMWQGVSLSAGPTVIDGLSSFYSTEFVTSESDFSSPDGEGYYFRTTPTYDDREIKEMSIKIKTNSLKGKVDWSYNSKKRSVSFIVDFIQFEVMKNNNFNYVRKNGNWEYDNSGRQRYYPDGSYTRSSTNETNVNVYLGNIQIKSSKSSICENESEFVNFVLSEYLKTVISDFLRNSLHEKIQNESVFVDCD